MRRFLLKIAVAGGLALLAHAIAGFLAGEWTDAFYLRFTTPPQSSLILGSSRAAQGLKPEVISEILQAPVYNFSFTGNSSPYGEVYNRAIRKKLDPSARSGTFILAVDPWGLSSRKDDSGEEIFQETDDVLGVTRSFDESPNFEYLIRHYDKGWGKLILNSLGMDRSELHLHRDGWLEVIRPLDEKTIAERTKARVDFYRETTIRRFISESRLKSFENLLEMLGQHGKIYLVRLPTGRELYELETNFWPSFDDEMREISQKYGAPYWAMQSDAEGLQFHDGNHIARVSAGDCSKKVASWIVQPK